MIANIIGKFKQYQFVFEELVKRDFKKKYKRTVLGMTWSILSPLLTLIVMRLVFTQFFGRTTPHYTTYLFCGNLIFSYFNESTTQGMTSLMGNAGIFTKVNVPKYLFLFSKNVQTLINFGLTLCVYFLFCSLDGITFTWKLIFLLYPIFFLVLFNIGVGLILSALFVFFRDIQYLWSVFTQLLMSNNAHVAAGKTEGISSPATIEVLDFAYQLYQVDKTARPFDYVNWDFNASIYNTGTVGFWTTRTWFQHANGLSSDVGFEIGMVPWPIGPSGNQETNSQIAVSGNWMMIPLGVERPELVYEVLKEYTNWYNGDLEYRDETEWHEDKVETERNFEYIKMMGQTMPWFDFWAKIKELEAGQRMVGMYVDQIMTAAQVAEQYKQIVQDYLDLYLN